MLARLRLMSKHSAVRSMGRDRFRRVPVLGGCLPAEATYRPYMNDMEAFVPVLLLTIFVYAYEFTNGINLLQTELRQRW
ncbi:hypothetical protein BBJ28_00002471 [Nothophytophthora sp. Chile5]|nr:hypothetical protein BBJ28_00002471 [Nothophytophthora sp. Chile5]